MPDTVGTAMARGCECSVDGGACPRLGLHLVRIRAEVLGTRVPETIRMCAEHRSEAEAAGDVVKPRPLPKARPAPPARAPQAPPRPKAPAPPPAPPTTAPEAPVNATTDNPEPTLADEPAVGVDLPALEGESLAAHVRRAVHELGEASVDLLAPRMGVNRDRVYKAVSRQRLAGNLEDANAAVGGTLWDTPQRLTTRGVRQIEADANPMPDVPTVPEDGRTTAAMPARPDEARSAHVRRILAELGPSTASAIGHAGGLVTNAVHKTIAAEVRFGRAQRHPDTSPRVYSLTAEGRAMLDRADAGASGVGSGLPNSFIFPHGFDYELVTYRLVALLSVDVGPGDVITVDACNAALDRAAEAIFDKVGMKAKLAEAQEERDQALNELEEAHRTIGEVEGRARAETMPADLRRAAAVGLRLAAAKLEGAA